MKKREVDLSQFEWKPINIVNGKPWPRLPKDIPSEVPLKKEYMMRSMDYLDTPQAAPIFEKQADIIIEYGCKNIIDVGSRHGPVNDILYDRGYQLDNYFGFDTSPQPIEIANLTWEEFPHINYKVASWEDIEDIKVDFKADCIIWSGVLLYEPDTHMELFERLHNMYQAERAIIQEPCYLQPEDKWLDVLELNTIEDQLYLYDFKYDEYETWVIDADIFSGRRRISTCKVL